MSEDKLPSRVTQRGQITIDRAARKALSITKGMEAVQVVVDDHLEIYFLPPRHRRSLFGTLPPREGPVGADWEALEEQAGRSIADEA